MDEDKEENEEVASKDTGTAVGGATIGGAWPVRGGDD